MNCYRREHRGVYPWDDETEPELAQNTGHVWIYEALRHHPLRTRRPDEAALVVLPVETFVSSRLKNSCEGKR